MGRLFWKIFFWFWVAMILMTLGIAWAITQYFQTNETQPSMLMSRLAAPQVSAVASILQHGGEAVSRKVLRDMSSSSRVQVFVVDNHGQELLGRSIPEVNTLTSNYEQPGKLNRRRRQSIDIHAISLEGNSYRVFASLSSPPRILQKSYTHVLARPFMRDPQLIVVRLSAAILVSGLVCFWLAWYLTRPVKRLREATKRLSEGDLSTRVAKSIGKRRDEIADLGGDFDQMAERLQSLLTVQQQLLNDVSHELRSPLARLQVAIGLARKKSSAEITHELDRIEQESKRLDELVGQVLTLARNDANAAESRDDYIDIHLLLEDIIRDARFEATERDCRITLAATEMPIIKGNLELLRRALENIIRNAIHHTVDNSDVNVKLMPDSQRKEWIKISVCDHGPGVPDKQINRLFEPFFRVSSARDRNSGGYGLGLAIASRAILLHDGEISAHNRKQDGLCIAIHLMKERDDEETIESED